MKSVKKSRASHAKNLFLILCSMLTAYLLARFCHHQTHGFSLGKISNNFCLLRNFYTPCLSLEEENEIKIILNQEFTYLGRGLQSFVFESEDKRYVLKIFNNRYQSKIKYLHFLPVFFDWKTAKIKYLLHKLEKIFTSYEIAFCELKKETGLLFIHLNPTDIFGKKVMIRDPLNISHEIDLDQTAFLLQKKAQLVYPFLEEKVAAGQVDSAKKAISDLLSLFVLRCKKGIADNDPLIRTNFGFLDGRPIHLDVGPFVKDSSIKDPRVYVKEIVRITESLKKWCETNQPPLFTHLVEELQQLQTAETQSLRDNL